MSFLDPFLDAFSSIGDSVSDFAESDEGKLAMIAAAAYLTGGTSLGAEAGAGGAGGFLEGMEAVNAIEGAGVAGTGISSLGAAAPAVAAASPLATTPIIPSAITSAPPTPENLSLLQNTGWTDPRAPLDTSGVTNIVQNARPVSEGVQLAQAGPVDPNAPGLKLTQNEILSSIGKPAIAPEAVPNVANYGPINANYAPSPMSTAAPATNSLAGSSGTGIKAVGAEIPQPNLFERGFNAFSNLNPYAQFGLGYLGAYNLGLLDPRNVQEQEKYNGPLTRYKMSPNFQPSTVTPNVYRPRYAAQGGIMQAGGPVEQMSNANSIGANTGFPQSDLHQGAYATPWQTPVPQNVVQGATDVNIDRDTGQQKFAQGGIAHFARGNLAEALDFYKSMTEPRHGKGASAPKGDADVGIYYDLDPDTRYQDALTAAQIRQAKINKRAYVTPPVAKRPTPMGQLNLSSPGAQTTPASSYLDPEMAAQGGIMHSSLGGYAAGGNPRLLKGPGDGMSDNIPATIAGKQPARLADGEFVIPADVVSHLGNGSTDAGAKRLHEMMNKVRKARTGNPKQGKQINANKYMPT